MSTHEVTSPGLWASKRKTRMLTLPSGAVVEAVDSKLHPLILSNILPMALVMRTLQSPQDQKEMTPKDVQEAIEGVKRVMEMVRRVVINPKISMEAIPAEGEVSILDIPDEDITALMAFVLRKKEAEELAPFRRGTNGDNA